MSGRAGALVRFYTEIVHEQIAFRELLLQLTRRDLLLRYKQTAIGFAWAIFMPLVNTALFWAVFTRVTHVETGTPYLLFAYIGLAAWNFSATALRFAAVSLTGSVTLVTKVYCPREVFPLSAVTVACVDFLVSATLLVPLLAWFRITLTPALWILPAVLVVHLALTAGLALFLAMATLFYRDVKYLFEVVLTVWMFASSVVYPVAQVGGRLGWGLRANPMAIIIDAYRAALLEGRLPAAGPFLWATAASAVVLLAGSAVFHRAESVFAERV